jgi:hypothetical protein
VTGILYSNRWSAFGLWRIVTEEYSTQTRGRRLEWEIFMTEECSTQTGGKSLASEKIVAEECSTQTGCKGLS